MSIEGQGLFFTIYFTGFVCFLLNQAKISDERLQDHWSSGYQYFNTVVNVYTLFQNKITLYFNVHAHVLFLYQCVGIGPLNHYIHDFFIPNRRNDA